MTDGHHWDDSGERCLRCGDKDWMADEFCSNHKKPVKAWEMYCPVCACIIEASNIAQVSDGDHDSYIFVHKDIVHSDDDLSAISNGMN